jgi:glycolate oxidase FAD binding subunit
LPLPKAEGSLDLGFESAADACAFAAEVHRRGLALRGGVLLNAAAAAAAGATTRGANLLSLDVAGSPSAVERTVREVAELARARDAFVFKRGRGRDFPATYHEEVLTVRLATLPSRLPSLIAAIEACGGAPAVMAEPATGVLRAAWTGSDDAEALLARVRETASRTGTSAVAEACPHDLKRRTDVFGGLPPSFALMRSVKEQFDPGGVLSPGRFVGRL